MSRLISTASSNCKKLIKTIGNNKFDHVCIAHNKLRPESFMPRISIFNEKNEVVEHEESKLLRKIYIFMRLMHLWY